MMIVALLTITSLNIQYAMVINLLWFAAMLAGFHVRFGVLCTVLIFAILEIYYVRPAFKVGTILFMLWHDFLLGECQFTGERR